MVAPPSTKLATRIAIIVSASDQPRSDRRSARRDRNAAAPRTTRISGVSAVQRACLSHPRAPLDGQPVTPAVGEKADSARFADAALTLYVCEVPPVAVSVQLTDRTTTGTPTAWAWVMPPVK